LQKETAMIRYNSTQQIPIEEFKNPFAFALSKDNRWVKLAAILPWDELATIYHRTLSASKKGRPCKDARMVIGALIIKHKEVLSDRRTLESIQENIYQQYFIGLSEYTYEPVFDSTLFVSIRKRLGAAAFDEMVEKLMRVVSPTVPLKPIPSSDDETIRDAKDIDSPSSPETESVVETAKHVSAHSAALGASGMKKENAGMLVVDMTVAPADIAYPTDIELLNTAREKTEHLIDVLYAQIPKDQENEKPRTYRERARREYLAIAKQKKRSSKTIRKALRKQLNFVHRNIDTIRALLTLVPDGLMYCEMREFWVIQELYRQQSEMYQERTHRVDHRIVSITQPQVRPIVRGKASAPVEFGAQVSLSVHANGFNRIHRIEWDAYNEGSDLQGQVESYKTQHGQYPEIVLADKKYGTKDNRAFMKAHGIKYGGTPLGRPKSDGTRNDLLDKKTVNKRNWIEATFGTGKRSYGLDNIRAKRADTSESWIASIFFMMNLSALLKIMEPQVLSLFSSMLDGISDLADLPGKGERKYHFVIS
jgi:transposase, IS5 family